MLASACEATVKEKMINRITRNKALILCMAKPPHLKKKYNGKSGWMYIKSTLIPVSIMKSIRRKY